MQDCLQARPPVAETVYTRFYSEDAQFMNAKPSAMRGRIRRSFRNRLRHFVLTAGLMILAAPTLGFAADDLFDYSGPYLGVSGVYQKNVFESRIEDLLDDAVPGSVSLSMGDSGGLGALVGYRLNSVLAAELQYEWVDSYDIEGSVDDSPTLSLYSMTGHTLTGNAKLIVPFWRVQPYLVVGVGVSIFDVDMGELFNDPIAGPALASAGIEVENGTRTSFAGRAGLGLDIHLTDHITINAQGQVVLTTLKKPGLGDITDLNYLGFSAGLRYRF